MAKENKFLPAIKLSNATLGNLPDAVSITAIPLKRKALGPFLESKRPDKADVGHHAKVI